MKDEVIQMAADIEKQLDKERVLDRAVNFLSELDAVLPETLTESEEAVELLLNNYLSDFTSDDMEVIQAGVEARQGSGFLEYLKSKGRAVTRSFKMGRSQVDKVLEEIKDLEIFISKKKDVVKKKEITVSERHAVLSSISGKHANIANGEKQLLKFLEEAVFSDKLTATIKDLATVANNVQRAAEREGENSETVAAIWHVGLRKIQDKIAAVYSATKPFKARSDNDRRMTKNYDMFSSEVFLGNLCFFYGKHKTSVKKSDLFSARNMPDTQASRTLNAMSLKECEDALKQIKELFLFIKDNGSDLDTSKANKVFSDLIGPNGEYGSDSPAYSLVYAAAVFYNYGISAGIMHANWHATDSIHRLKLLEKMIDNLEDA